MFEDHFLELDALSIIINVEKKKQELAVCLSIPDHSEHECDIKTKALRSLGKEKLGSKDGLNQLGVLCHTLLKNMEVKQA